MLDCLINLVGLTDKDCNCFDESKPAEFEALNVSETGYYLTDEDYGLPLLESIFAGNDCGDGSVWDVLVKSRLAAINSVYTDLQAAILKYYDKAIQPFSGLIGKARSTSTRTITSAFAGHLIQPRPIKDAAFVVKHVWLGVNQAGPITVTFDSNDPDFTAYSQVLTVTTPGVFQKFALTTPQSLDLYSKNVQDDAFGCGLRYTVSYPISGGLKPLNNVFKCCGDDPQYKKYMNVGGFEGDSVDTVLDNCGYSCNGNANGLVLDGYMTCDNLQWLCELEELNGYDIRDVLARSIQYKATVLLAQHILDSTEINYWTTLNREALYGKRNHAKTRFDALMDWIAQNLPSYATGCYTCKPASIRRKSF